MARRCGPTKPCGMSQGLFNPFFQNGANWFGAGGSTTDPDVADYEARVVAAGGALQEGDAALLTTFKSTLVTAGIWDKVLDCGFFLGGFAGCGVKLKYADADYKSLNLSAGSSALVSGDYNESTGLSATGTGRKADTQFSRSGVGLTKDNYSHGYFCLDDFQTTNAFLMCDNLVSGAAGTYLAKTTNGLNAAVTPPSNRSITTPQTRLGQPNFRWLSSNGKILWGRDYVQHYPIGVVDTPNIDLALSVSLFGGRNNGSAVSGTGRLVFYFVGEYLTYNEVAALFQAVEDFLVAKGRLTNVPFLVTFGDSVTRGTGATVFSDRYSYVLANTLSLREKNMGIDSSAIRSDGNTVISGFNRRDSLLKVRRVAGSRMHFQYGINDINADGNADGDPTAIADFKSKYKQIISEVIAGGWLTSELSIGSVGYINNGTSLTKMEAYGTACQEIASELSISYKAVRENMISGGGNTLLSDTLHPNTAGHANMAETIAS